jgi:presenilin-like A22 family membrane protease
MVRTFSLLLWYSLAAGTSVLVAGALVSGRVPVVLREPVLVSGADWLVFGVVFSVATVLLLWLGRHLNAVVRYGVLVAIAAGIAAGASLVVAPAVALIIAASATACMVWVPRTITHNLIIAVAMGSISACIGVWAHASWVVVALCGFAFYDIISVYATRHMVALAKTLTMSGPPAALVIPVRYSDLLRPPLEVLDRGALLLGSGDIGLPLLLVAATRHGSLVHALWTAGGAVVGVLAMHLLFTFKSNGRPMAALPPIALGTILGYLVGM